MQAIITKYFPQTNTKPARIKASCSRGSKFTSVHSNKMIESLGSHTEENHRVAAQELINQFVLEDVKRHPTPGSINPWNGKFVTGSLPHGYAHVFID